MIEKFTEALNSIIGSLKEVKLDFFLTGTTALRVKIGKGFKTPTAIYIGSKWKDFSEKNFELLESMKEKGFKAEKIEAPYKFVRGLKFTNIETGISIYVIAYFSKDGNLLCPFSNGSQSLYFPEYLTENTKRIKFKNKTYSFFEDYKSYFEHTFGYGYEHSWKTKPDINYKRLEYCPRFDFK